MSYQGRNAKDTKILVRLAALTLNERYKHIQDLIKSLEKIEASVERKQMVKRRTKKQETQLLTEENEIVELRYQLKLERAEYLAQKDISPDYVEGVMLADSSDATG